MLDEYKAAVEVLAGQELSEYTASIADTFRGRLAAGKEINDPVWGTLALSALETLVLDSPLLQRLRRVEQLGVAHWVYPGAAHSRLQHSIGALGLASRLLNSIDGEVPGAKIPQKYHQPVRLAALCHDVGHGVMSHVSENALAHVVLAEDVKNEFTETHGREKQLGEINSFFLIGSPAFRELLEAAARAAGVALELPDVASFMQDCVIAKPVDPEFPVLHQIVSGPFDADKLDYMTRDAYMSGVPVVTDVNRLIRKVRGIRIPRDKAPREIQRLSSNETDTVVVIGIDRSGNRTVDELTLGRTLLFDKLYRHHKTRACEAMVTAILVKLAAAAEEAGQPVEAVLLALRLDDSHLLSSSFADQLKEFVLPEDTAAFVQRLVQHLRERRLFVRAAAFSRKMTGDEYDRDDEQASGLQSLLADLTDPIRRRQVALGIARPTQTALDALGLAEEVAQWPGELSDYIWVDGVRSADHLTASSKAMLVTQEGEVIPFATEAPETPQWALAYQQTRDAAFVFCPPKIAVAVAFATEALFRSDYGVRLPKSALIGMRRSSSRGTEERERLAETGFYDDQCHDLRPVPQRLMDGDADSILTGVANRLRGYCQPLVEPEHAGRDNFGAGRVRDFVRQFDTDDLIDAALSIMEEVRLIDRRDVVAPLATFLSDNADYHNASLVVFGSAADSSSIETYFSLDVQGRFPDVRAREIGDALAQGTPIIFVDDIIGSGAQGASIVDAWFGNMEGAEALGEERKSLLEDFQPLIRSTPVAFCFASGLEGGVDTLRQSLSRNGMRAEATVIVGLEESSLPSVFTAGAVEPGKRKRFIERCREIGAQLLQDQSPDNASERALGYGNKGLVMTFPYNTPSQALTCLWARGTVDGKPWTPLLPRRRKR